MTDLPNQETKQSSGLKRTRTQRKSRKQEKGESWLKKYWLDSVLLLGLITAVFLIIFTLTSIENDQIVFLAAGSGLFLLILVLGAGRLRRHINHHRAFWATSCSSCDGKLKRMKRKPVDHLISKMGIPARRYICADCHWQGRKIDQTRL